MNAAAACALLCASAPAAVDGPLTYAAPAGCGSEESFVTELRQHAPGFSVSQLVRADRAVQIRLEPNAAGAEGSWILTEAGQYGDERRFEAADCGAVLSALAISLAIGLESIPFTLYVPPPETSRWTLGAAAGVRLDRPLRNVTPLGVHAAVQLRKQTGEPLRFFSEWRLGAQASDGGLNDGRASFSWAGGNVGGCWVSYSLSAAVEAGLCSEFFGGAIRGTGEEVFDAASVVRGWFSVSSWVSIRWLAFENASLLVSGGAEVPLVQREFALASPERPLTESLAVTPSVRLSLEYWQL